MKQITACDARLGKQQAYRLIVIQLLMTALLSLAFMFRAPFSALSSVIAGLLMVGASLVMARGIFRYQGEAQAKRIVRSFYLAECRKILMVVAAMAVLFKFAQVDYLAFFMTMFLVQLVVWFYPIICKH